MAKLLPSLLKKMSGAMAGIHSMRGKCELTAGQHNAEKEDNAEKEFSSIQEQRHVMNYAVTKTDEPRSSDKTSDGQESTSATSDVLASSCQQCSRVPFPAANPGLTSNTDKNPPEAPTGCCMSGCPNCVWLQFAEEMMEYSSDGNDRARRFIESIEDENMKTFLLLEMERMKKL